MRMMKHKICPNCGAVMTFDNHKFIWICLLCGYAEEVSKRKDLYSNEYIG